MINEGHQAASSTWSDEHIEMKIVKEKVNTRCRNVILWYCTAVSEREIEIFPLVPPASSMQLDHTLWGRNFIKICKYKM